MTTKAQVTEFINNQWEHGEDSSLDAYWLDTVPGVMVGNRLSIVQNWITPEIAVILEKLTGETYLVSRVAKNRSNNA